MGGAGGEASETAPFSEMTWEVLIVDSELEMKLWARYDHSKPEEREQAFLAVIHVMDSLKPEQAEKLAKNFLERSGNAPDPEHRKKLLEMLERLGSKFESAMKNISQFAAKAVGSPLESGSRKKDVHDMMANIAREIKDTGYKYCLQGNENELKRCTERLVSEGHKNAEEHMRRFLDRDQEPEQRAAVLMVVAKNQISFGKDYVPKLLESTNASDVVTGLRLIREYEMVGYRNEIEKLRRSRYESVIQEVDQTLSYLATRAPAKQ